MANLPDAVKRYRSAILAAGGFLAVTAMLGLEIVNQLDKAVFLAAISASSIVKWPLLVAMQAGSILVALMTAGFLALSRQIKLAGVLFAAAMASWLLAGLIKVLVARPRPGFLTGSTSQIKLDGFGYPSSHVAVAAAMGYVLAKNASLTWKLLAGLVVLLTGLGRMYFGVHMPMDVVGGALLGVAVASVLDCWQGQNLTE